MNGRGKWIGACAAAICCFAGAVLMPQIEPGVPPAVQPGFKAIWQWRSSLATRSAGGFREFFEPFIDSRLFKCHSFLTFLTPLIRCQAGRALTTMPTRSQILLG